MLDFTKQTLQDFDCQPYHEKYYEALNRFAKGGIKKLIISMPPQHGKSEGSSRRLPAFVLGLDPNKKIAIGSYSSSLAQDFNRDVQRIMDSELYHGIFPNTQLNRSNVVTIANNYLRNSNVIEIVGKRGLLRVVGRGGALTGKTVDMMILDDLYKDYAEGKVIENPLIVLTLFARCEAMGWNHLPEPGSLLEQNIETLKAFDVIFRAKAEQERKEQEKREMEAKRNTPSSSRRGRRR